MKHTYSVLEEGTTPKGQQPVPPPPIRFRIMATVSDNIKGNEIELGTSNVKDILGDKPNTW